MKRVFAILVTTLLIATGAAAATAESSSTDAITEDLITISNDGGTIYGTMVTPARTRGETPVVLLLHGFTGVRDELPIIETDGSINEAMFSRTARIFAENGIATLRIDFRGSGESIDEFGFEGTTFSGQVSDAIAAVDYLSDQRRLGPIGVLGLSQGGLVTAIAAAEDARIKSVALWSPVANPVDTYKTILGADNVADGLTQPSTNIVLPWGAVIDLNQPFFEDVYALDPVASITGYDGPLQVVVGINDTTVTPQPYYGQVYVDYHDGTNELLVLEGDHIFDALVGNGAPALSEAIDASLGWFADSLRR